MRGSVLQCVAVRCSALQCVAVHCTDSCVKDIAALNLRIRALKLYIECTRYFYSIPILSSMFRARQKQNTSIYIFSRKPLYKNTSSRGFLICMGGAEVENYSKLCKGASPRHVSSQIIMHNERKLALYRPLRQRLCTIFIYIYFNIFQHTTSNIRNTTRGGMMYTLLAVQRGHPVHALLAIVSRQLAWMQPYQSPCQS